MDLADILMAIGADQETVACNPRRLGALAKAASRFQTLEDHIGDVNFYKGRGKFARLNAQGTLRHRSHARSECRAKV
jgi:hypothetical protein